MKISVETQYHIGDTVRIPNAHTTKDVQITDVLIQVGKHGPAFAEITYLTNDPVFQSVMETAIIEFVAPPEQPVAEQPKTRNNHQLFSNKAF